MFKGLILAFLIAAVPAFAGHKLHKTRTGNIETLVFYVGTQKHEVALNGYEWNNSGCIIYRDSEGKQNTVCGNFWLIEN